MKEYKVIVDDNGKQFWFEGGVSVVQPIDWRSLMSPQVDIQRLKKTTVFLNQLFPLKSSDVESFEVTYHRGSTKKLKINYPLGYDSFIISPFDSVQVKGTT